MKKALITGISGFVGGYLGRLLRARGYEVHGTCFGDADNVDPAQGFTLHELDITDAGAVQQLLAGQQYEAIYHLAAQASAALSWKKPGMTMAVNEGGCINLLEAARQHAAGAALLLVGSSEEYGFISPERSTVDERHPAQPGNPYAVSKLAQNHLGRLYAQAYGMRVIMTRAFNHTGPGQTAAFALPSFARQIAEAEAGLRPPRVQVGNLSAARDFSDVRDVVRAYYLLAGKGEAGQTYNVGSGQAHTLKHMLDMLIGLAHVDIKVESDPQRMRPVDVPLIVCNPDKLRAATGWQPELRLEKTLTDLLEYWRAKVEEER